MEANASMREQEISVLIISDQKFRPHGRKYFEEK
jgi:hypothetical protein